MADHQVVGAFRGRPVFKGADFFVCATNANLKHAHFDLIGFSQSWSFMLDDLHLFGPWKNCNCFHLFDSSFSFFRTKRTPLITLTHHCRVGRCSPSA